MGTRVALLLLCMGAAVGALTALAVDIAIRIFG